MPAQLKAIHWTGSTLKLLDQRHLPQQEVWLELTTHQQVAQAIRDMVVRGAPAIGVAAAYGMVLAEQEGTQREVAHMVLAASRPTAVNLFWALDQMSAQPYQHEALEAAAQKIEADDLKMNQKIGENGNALIPHGAQILTICNTGSLATAGHGTALGVIRTAHAEGKEIFVYSCETRPRLQGLKLTAWELDKEQIPFKSIADSAAGHLMQLGKVDLVIAGADRIAANGDTANKIGTYSLAVLAHHHKVPFYIAAPSSTIDPNTPSGESIPIEQRAASEILEIDEVPVGIKNGPVYNPAFDVTPGKLITAIVTEEGVLRSPYSFST